LSESGKQLPDDFLGNNPFIAGRAYSGIADKNGIVRVKIDGPVRGVMLLESGVLVVPSIAYVRNGYVSIRLTAIWEFLERIDVDTTGTNFDFGTAVSNSDTELRIEGYWLGSANTAVLQWRINGALSSTLSNCHTQYLGVASATSASTGGLIISVPQSAAATEQLLKSKLFIDKAQNRLMQSDSVLTDGTSAANTDRFMLGGKWEDVATDITSVGVGTTRSSHVLAGSHFTLYRRPKLNKTKIKLWIY